MTTKLTLSIEKSTIEKAKSYAKETGRSLSSIIESYLESMVSNTTSTSTGLTKLRGVVKLPANFNEKTEIQEQLSKKHNQ